MESFKLRWSFKILLIVLPFFINVVVAKADGYEVDVVNGVHVVYPTGHLNECKFDMLGNAIPLSRCSDGATALAQVCDPQNILVLSSHNCPSAPWSEMGTYIGEHAGNKKVLFAVCEGLSANNAPAQQLCSSLGVGGIGFKDTVNIGMNLDEGKIFSLGCQDRDGNYKNFEPYKICSNGDVEKMRLREIILNTTLFASCKSLNMRWYL